ncbi:hypothetical protein HXX76_015393 [Chlamydomonas incerta]|uniref:Uncharacterized protein n=1 Tax=Chlamydomonas incerta TaxID=51695 RepID=A0A835SMF2_CHLIN|nr:hypothetical protein HXX76_015393 [Chlamydomonas incerta]|eukprot:KAG2423345.1 hypothetical protein HXX76_015393 [Chlamydomonas incerta]
MAVAAADAIHQAAATTAGSGGDRGRGAAGGSAGGAEDDPLGLLGAVGADDDGVMIRDDHIDDDMPFDAYVRLAAAAGRLGVAGAYGYGAQDWYQFRTALFSSLWAAELAAGAAVAAGAPLDEQATLTLVSAGDGDGDGSALWGRDGSSVLPRPQRAPQQGPHDHGSRQRPGQEQQQHQNASGQLGLRAPPPAGGRPERQQQRHWKWEQLEVLEEGGLSRWLREPLQVLDLDQCHEETLAAAAAEESGTATGSSSLISPAAAFAADAAASYTPFYPAHKRDTVGSGGSDAVSSGPDGGGSSSYPRQLCSEGAASAAAAAASSVAAGPPESARGPPPAAGLRRGRPLFRNAHGDEDAGAGDLQSG